MNLSIFILIITLSNTHCCGLSNGRAHAINNLSSRHVHNALCCKLSKSKGYATWYYT